MSSNDERKRQTRRIILEVFICVVLILGAILLSRSKKTFNDKFISSAAILAPGSRGYRTWLNPPITTSRSYYLFNITNPLDIILHPNSKSLIVQDTPPYVYNVETKKCNVSWSNNHKHLNYSVERVITRHPTEFKSERLNDTGVFINLLRAIFRTLYEPVPSRAFYDIGTKDPFSKENPVNQLEGFTSSLFQSMRDKMIGPNTEKYGYIFRQNGSRLYNMSIETS